MSLPKRIIFSGHDPASAHAIAPVLQECRAQGSLLFGFGTGPALAIFKSYGLPCTDASSMQETVLIDAVRKCAPDLFLSGTSGGVQIDKRIMSSLKELPSVYVLDFWTNYWQRFSNQEKDFFYLPDLICVMDEQARIEMLNEGFPSERIIVTGNPYFSHFSDSVSTKDEDKYSILFVSQPVSETSRLPGSTPYGFDEYSVLRALKEATASLSAEYTVFVRPHPKESAEKFNSFLDARTRLSGVFALEEDLSRAGLVVGMFSPVLMQAAAAGKQVLSVQLEAMVPDPLPSNRLGLTRRIVSSDELRRCLREYAAGKRPGKSGDVGVLFPKDATERVLKVLETFGESSVL